jgi:hypothetical protein
MQPGVIVSEADLPASRNGECTAVSAEITYIRTSRGSRAVNLRELWQYRELLGF